MSTPIKPIVHTIWAIVAVIALITVSVLIFHESEANVRKERQRIHACTAIEDEGILALCVEGA